ncbi:MAG: hypothetical protein GF320_16500, partial [Armatimonadia bacterium]|nr:hypothetical protein [Armatimonadia bacterium]
MIGIPLRTPRAHAAGVPLLLAALMLLGGTAWAQQEPPAIEGVTWMETEGTPGRYDIIMANLAEGSLPERVYIHARDASNYLALDLGEGQARLVRALGGAEESVAVATLPEGYAAGQVVIEWRFDRVRVYAGHEVLLEHFEHALVSGFTGHVGDIGGAQLWFQPIDRVIFSDSFGRLEANMGDWTPETGQWSNIQSEGEARESANPFAFEGQAGTVGDGTMVANGQPVDKGEGPIPFDQTWYAVTTPAAAPTAGPGYDPAALEELGFSVFIPESPAQGQQQMDTSELYLPYAMATTGYPFWTDYYVESAIRSEGASAIGLVALCESAPAEGTSGNFIAARWTSQMDLSPDGDKLQIVKVADGVQEVLAEAGGGFVPMQWYRLRLAVGEDITVSIDGREALSIPNDSGYGRGRLGLYSEGFGGARFDDTRANQIDTMHFAFPEDADEWRTSPGVTSSDAGLTAGDSGGTAIYPRVLGNVDITIDVAAAGASGEALLSYRGDDSHWAVVWAEGEEENFRLIRRSPAGEELLATGSRPLTATDSGKLRILTRADLFRIQWDGETIIERAEPLRLDMPENPSQLDEGSGDEGAMPLVGALALKIGAGTSPVIGGVAVDQPKKPRAAELTEQFALETATMAEWATTAGAWIDPAAMGASDQVVYRLGRGLGQASGAAVQPPDEPPTPVWWNKGDFYGDTEVR